MHALIVLVVGSLLVGLVLLVLSPVLPKEQWVDTFASGYPVGVQVHELWCGDQPGIATATAVAESQVNGSPVLCSAGIPGSSERPAAAGTGVFQVTLIGQRFEDIEIERLRVHKIQSAPPLTGSLFIPTLPSGIGGVGGAPGSMVVGPLQRAGMLNGVGQLNNDLILATTVDNPTPSLAETVPQAGTQLGSSTSTVPEDYFGFHTITLRHNDRFTVVILARAAQGYTAWDLDMNFRIGDGSSQTVRINKAGVLRTETDHLPFVVSALPGDIRNYRSLFVMNRDELTPSWKLATEPEACKAIRLFAPPEALIGTNCS